MNLPATAAAWYGAIVSTLGFSLALYVALRDRARVRIFFQANMLAYGSEVDPSAPDRKHVVITVANMGRRTVTVSAVWLTPAGKGDEILLTDSVRSKEIAEGQSEAYVTTQDGLNIANLRSVGVRDQVGRVWRKRIPRSARRTATRRGVE
jgi:hypothetical protein